MNPTVFREYDIRGVVGRDIGDDDVARLGGAFGTYMVHRGKKRVVVGRDCRNSSERFRDLLVRGLLATGMDVLDVGVCPTPLLYFAIRHLDREGGVMITASHNPPEYNGFKICDGYDAIYGPEIQKLKQIFDGARFAGGDGKVAAFDIVTPYAEFIAGNIAFPPGLRVGIDAGNGTAGPIVLPILERLGCKVYPLYCDMDGNFPNHEPDPTVLSNLGDLRDLVRRESLHLGLAFDGDGDRLGVVDQTGTPVFGDKLMVIFAREILSRKPGSTFVSEVKCSKTLYDDIERRGGRVVMWRAGHSLIKAKMKEVDAALAGEMSGHVFFKDRYFGFDDGIYAACRLLEILAETGRSIPELLEGLPATFSTPEIRLDCPDDMKFDLVERAKGLFVEMGLQVIDVDGARIVFPDGWGLVRASNTQPALVLRYEAETEERLGEIRELIEEGIRRARSKH